MIVHDPELLPLLPDDVLTHIGTASKFQNSLRAGRGELGISMILGQHQVQEAVRLAIDREPVKRDRVRHTTVGRLREAGFWPCRWPVPGNPLHVLVQFPGEWDDSIATAFEGCFDESGE